MGEPNLDATADPMTPGCCRELYRFQATDGSLECISCNRGGATTNAPDRSFAISPDGGTVAFSTAEPLVGRDVNRSTDIYEWRNGSLGLITDGVTTYLKELAAPVPDGVSAGGRDILFQVQDPGLTGYERDPFANLYDARIGGGFERPTPAVHCSEESCQGPLQAPPVQQVPGSLSFSGQGNVGGAKARTCAKGKARRRGRCVGRHAHKKSHKRASNAKREGKR